MRHLNQYLYYFVIHSNNLSISSGSEMNMLVPCEFPCVISKSLSPEKISNNSLLLFAAFVSPTLAGIYNRPESQEVLFAEDALPISSSFRVWMASYAIIDSPVHVLFLV